MPIEVKDAATSANKWNRNASTASEDYAANAEARADKWARGAAAAADTWRASVQAANVHERFRRGVNRAGAQKYARKIRDVGRDRYAPGISAAEGDYRSGVEPYLQTIAGLTLSQRRPRGDPANYNRVTEVGRALNARRMALLGSGGG